MSDFNRTCFNCDYKLTNYDEYYYHYQDFHWDVMINIEMKMHYCKEVHEEYFKDKDAQPFEWIIGEPVVFQELRIMFGDVASKLWGSEVLREYDIATNTSIPVPEYMTTALERLRDANFYEAYNRPSIARKRTPPITTPPQEKRLKLKIKLKEDWRNMQAKELLQPRELNTPPPRSTSPEQPPPPPPTTPTTCKTI